MHSDNDGLQVDEAPAAAAAGTGSAEPLTKMGNVTTDRVDGYTVWHPSSNGYWRGVHKWYQRNGEYGTVTYYGEDFQGVIWGFHVSPAEAFTSRDSMWKLYADPEGLHHWWHHADTGTWFYKQSGTHERPPMEYF